MIGVELVVIEGEGDRSVPPPAGASAERVSWLLARPVIRSTEVHELGPISKSTVARAISSGELPSHTMGRARLVKTSDAVAWLSGELS